MASSLKDMVEEAAEELADDIRKGMQFVTLSPHEEYLTYNDVMAQPIIATAMHNLLKRVKEQVDGEEPVR